MSNFVQLPRTRATLLFLLLPLIGELLFIDSIINDAYTRRRIRIVFSMVCLSLIAIGFSAWEIPILLGVQQRIIPIAISYPIMGVAALVTFLLFSIEGWAGKVSLEEQIVVTEDRVSLLLSNPREVFITLNRILNAAQLRRYRHTQCDNSRLARYALVVLGEYLRAKVLSLLKQSQSNTDVF